MCMTYFILLQKITVIVFLLIFFAGRFFWSFIKGKRVKTNVSNGIVNGRFWITLVVYVLLPLVLIFNLFGFLDTTTFSSNRLLVYIIGLSLSICGIVLMFLARLHREMDWGFMGDNAGDILFTQGIYSITRHPYYIGAIFLGLGIYLVLNSWLILFMFPVILFVKNVIKSEDKFLYEKFQDKWNAYRQKVGTFPFIRF